MQQRLSSFENAQGAINAMLGITKYLSKSKIEPQLLHLIEFRVSQINGCILSGYAFQRLETRRRHRTETIYIAGVA